MKILFHPILRRRVLHSFSYTGRASQFIRPGWPKETRVNSGVQHCYGVISPGYGAPVLDIKSGNHGRSRGFDEDCTSRWSLTPTKERNRIRIDDP